LVLPDGRTLSGPRGAVVGDFLRQVEGDFSAPIVAAIINNEIHELTYRIEIESWCRPVTMDSADGARIYRRSLVFLLEMVFADLFPDGRLFIDHSVSSGGFYCEVAGRAALTSADLDSLKAEMKKQVLQDHHFERKEVPIQQAVEYFKQRGDTDKIRLFAHRRKDYLTMYILNGRMDYMHGYMVPSTGYLRWFDLRPVEGGFILQFPRRHAPTQLEPMGHYPKLISAFRQYGDWLETLDIGNVGALNDAIQFGRADELILVSEALHEQHLADIPADRSEKIAHYPTRRSLVFRQDDDFPAAGHPAPGTRNITLPTRIGSFLY